MIVLLLPVYFLASVFSALDTFFPPFVTVIFFFFKFLSSYKHTIHIVFRAHPRASLVTQLVKNPPAMQETPVRSLGREDPLEKG